MSNLLIEFFDGPFLEVNEHLKPIDVKRYRNSIARASQALEHPAEYIDCVDPSFKTAFKEHLLRRGFSIRRCEEFLSCLRKVVTAMREHKRGLPRREPSILENAANWIADHPESIRHAFCDIIHDDDDVCAHAVDELEKLQAESTASEEGK